MVVFLPRVGPGLANPAGLTVLGFTYSVLFVVAAVTLRTSIFGPGSPRGAVAVAAAIIGVAAAVVGDLALAAKLPFQVLVVAAIVGQVSHAAWYLLAATSLAQAGLLRLLGWIGLGASIAYFVSAAVLAFQVLTDNFLGEAVRYVYLLLLLAIAFLARLGWFAITGVQLRPRTA
jgi:hypothetical protein